MIYFVQGTITKHIKIGFTSRPFIYRFKSLMSSDPLVCLKTMEGDALVEAQLHQRFVANRIHGEWFQPSKELLAFIALIPASAHDNTIQNQASNSRVHSEKGVYNKEERILLEAQWYEDGRKACNDGKPNEPPARIGKPYSTAWYSTRSSWQWGYEQAQIEAGNIKGLKKKHIDSRLNPDED